MKAHKPLQRPLRAGRRRPNHAFMRALLHMIGRLRCRWERQSSRHLECWAPRPTAGTHRMQPLGLLTSASVLGVTPAWAADRWCRHRLALMKLRGDIGEGAAALVARNALWKRLQRIPARPALPWRRRVVVGEPVRPFWPPPVAEPTVLTCPRCEVELHRRFRAILRQRPLECQTCGWQGEARQATCAACREPWDTCPCDEG